MELGLLVGIYLLVQSCAAVWALCSVDVSSKCVSCMLKNKCSGNASQMPFEATCPEFLSSELLSTFIGDLPPPAHETRACGRLCRLLTAALARDC